jgi:hypothetical protein
MKRCFSKTKEEENKEGNMGKFTLASVLTGVAVVFAGLTGSAGQAVAQSYTCMGFVTFKSTPTLPPGPPQTGINPYPEVQVSGNPIRVAASACHGATNTSFKADPGWTPQAVCESFGQPDKFGRTFNGTVRTMAVCAIDRFKEIAQPTQLYNRVNRYTVTCRSGKAVNVKWYPGLVGGVLPAC